jgi:predicted transcriptional regulator
MMQAQEQLQNNISAKRTVTQSRFRNRGDNAIIVDILKAASGKGLCRTQLMYKSNLSHRMLVEYAAYLIDRGLLETVVAHRSAEKVLYSTGEKGIKLLEAYTSLIDLCGGLAKFTAFSESAPSENLSFL